MNDEEKKKFTDDFIELYLSMGFGSLPKREIDLWVFNKLIKSSDYKDKTNYELAGLFQVPETKIKSLRLYSALKYEVINSHAILSRVIIRLIESDQYTELTEGKIEVSLEDPIEKRELENYLKKHGHHAEYSLNSEVLKIKPIRLFELIMEHVDSGEEVFAQIIQDNIEDSSISSRVLDGTETLKQKFNKLRKETLNIDTLKTLIGVGYGMLT